MKTVQEKQNSVTADDTKLAELARITTQMIGGTIRVLGKQNAALHQQILELTRANTEQHCPDLSDVHVDRVARQLFRAFETMNNDLEPPHDFDVMIECERGKHWRILACEAIRLGAVVASDGGDPNDKSSAPPLCAFSKNQS
jgi:hypothetical protein